MTEVAAAAQAIKQGRVIVYPTETVYGLGADATAPAAVARVFDIKERPRDNPLSIAVPDIETASKYAQLTDHERQFMQQFLPGPVTVVCKRRSTIPEIVTAGRDRVGIRIPDHETALALLAEVAPVTATSANKSGTGSVTTPEMLDPDVASAVAVIIDDGTSPGGESTVVDIESKTLHRHGTRAEAVKQWLAQET